MIYTFTTEMKIAHIASENITSMMDPSNKKVHGTQDGTPVKGVWKGRPDFEYKRSHQDTSHDVQQDERLANCVLPFVARIK